MILMRTGAALNSVLSKLRKQSKVNKCSQRCSTITSNKTPICWLDLRGSGLSILERLCLEESLLRSEDDNRFWMIVGHHEATNHRFLSKALPVPPYIEKVDAEDCNASVMIVMGIGGKAETLLNQDLVRRDGVWTIKRFSGGGTVVIDHNSIWTTLIGGRKSGNGQSWCAPYPRAIMQFSANEIFTPLVTELEKRNARISKTQNTKAVLDFGDNPSIDTANTGTCALRPTLILDNKSCCGLGITGKTLSIATKQKKSTTTIPLQVPNFKSSANLLQDHDYVIDNLKVGGNAQAIVQQGWLHHTSWLWDFDPENMMYLKLPSKRPEYRHNRGHLEFITSLSRVFPNLSKNIFYDELRQMCEKKFDLQVMTLPQALEGLQKSGGILRWLQQSSRNKILMDL